jgi:hypothetical protein
MQNIQKLDWGLETKIDNQFNLQWFLAKTSAIMAKRQSAYTRQNTPAYFGFNAYLLADNAQIY